MGGVVAAEAPGAGAGAEAAASGQALALCSEGLDLYGVLSFCAWPQRVAVVSLCQEARHKLGSHTVYWRFLCDRLAAEHNVYIPRPVPGRGDAPPPGIADSWRAVFEELYKIRHRFSSVDTKDVDSGQRLVIQVAARFRPLHELPGPADEDEEEEQGVVLPLHQKVQIVCDRYGCSKKEAMDIIMRERGQTALEDPYQDAEARALAQPEAAADAAAGAASGEEVPPSEPQASAQQALEDDLVEAEDSDTPAEVPNTVADGNSSLEVRPSILAVREDAGTVLAVAPGVGLREFGFDRVFSEKSRQADAYDYSAQRLVMDFLNGVNTSIICYGQTGSGKTYTMFGPGHGRRVQPDDQGIVPRALAEVLASIRERRERGMEMELGLSYVEIFGSEVSDLLQGQIVGQGRDGRYANVRATDRVGHRYVLDGRVEQVVESWEEVQELLERGDQAKRRAATAMNERSTRAHTLLMLTLTQQSPGVKVRSRLFLADLGGSEKISKSKADEGLVAPVLVVGGVEQHRVSWAEYYFHRQRIQETLQINKGLFALKQVIDALHTRQQMADQGCAVLPRIPYQNSKLTMLLKDALGGTSRTLVFCTAAMDSRHAGESLQTLRFGERCAQVRQRPDSDKAASVQAALRQLEQQIEALEAEIVRKERWEMRYVKRRDIDTIAGSFGDPTHERTEVIPTTVLVGAENEREELESLLQRQLDLQGLGGFAEKDYRDMKAKEAIDGGKGLDFRAKASFHSRCKAKDFEQEDVVVGALRFYFRRAKLAEQLFGETEESRRQRQPTEDAHENYYILARYLRSAYEEERAAGTELRSFGKMMLDLTQEWSKAFKAAPERREEELAMLAAKVPELCQAPSPASAGSGGYPAAAGRGPLAVAVTA